MVRALPTHGHTSKLVAFWVVVLAWAAVVAASSTLFDPTWTLAVAVVALVALSAASYPVFRRL
ncbi:hypothetical protein ACFO0N_05075 [Halobium salinum]|uniref:Secreted protein n=1 Tax=Halobium salinum TaxID=1364940 RepID=A0ABD5P8V6_9EURY|nr:hypothetical protein [Halobium salinum]